jgi:Holliday junction resolvase RusA-like endonuclease
MLDLHMTLDVVPTPQGRARHAVINGKAMTYKSKRQKDNERELELAMLKFKPQEHATRAIEIFVTAYMPIPSSAPKNERGAMLGEYVPHIKKPDLDNMLKNILDAMTRLGFWCDDSQVARIVAEKRYSACPRWEVRVVEFETY